MAFLATVFLLAAAAPKLAQWVDARWVLVLAPLLVLAWGRGDELAPLLVFLLFLWTTTTGETPKVVEQPTKAKVSSPSRPLPQKRKTRKKDKKRKTKMDRLKDDDPGDGHRTPAPPLQPLPEYLRLGGAGEEEIHGRLLPLVLSGGQLRADDFPLGDPARPGRALARSSLPPDATQRRCCRCRAAFEVVAGEYRGGTGECRHHTPLKVCPDTGRYECCGGEQGAPGCSVSPYHVTAQHSFAGVEFHRIRAKRQVSGGWWARRRGVYSLDCEMSYTTAGLEVVKVGLVGVDGLTVYETYVKPDNKILDHNTRYSGVTAEHLRHTTTRLADVQAFLLRHLNSETILVGHALANDLKALRILHERVVDTSVLYAGEGGGKCALRTLAKRYLGRDVQTSRHDCVEDARTSLALALAKIRDDKDENRNAFLLHTSPQRPSPVKKDGTRSSSSYAEVVQTKPIDPKNCSSHQHYDHTAQYDNPSLKGDQSSVHRDFYGQWDSVRYSDAFSDQRLAAYYLAQEDIYHRGLCREQVALHHSLAPLRC